MKTLTIIVLALAATLACAQGATPVQQQPIQPYDIKGDRLGMSLDEFKQKHYSVENGGGKNYADIVAPLCTDHVDGGDQQFHDLFNRLAKLKGTTPMPDFNAALFVPDGQASIGVIACYPGKNFTMDIALGRTPPTIANVPLKTYAFHFYQGKLFKIIAVFSVEGYDAMKTAFTEKFGAPEVTPHELQNAYGAKFDGEESNWTNGVSAIEMKRRVTDLSTGAMIMMMPDVQKQVEAALPKKAKDL
jgi:hypothetical protein